MTNHLKISLAILLAFLALAGCRGNKGDTGPTGTPGVSDKEIRFEFNISYSSNDTSWVLISPLSYLIKFDKNNYVDVDSAIFHANIGSSDVTVACSCELFDVTHNTPIAGSVLTSTDTSKIPNTILSGSWVSSGNVYSSLPNGETTIAVRFKSGRKNTMVFVNHAYLFLYRK